MGLFSHVNAAEPCQRAAAYLGGHLVFGEQIGVDHAAAQEMPKEFVPVLADADLPEGEMRRADASGVPVLLVRCEGEICALAHPCSHLGGPLSEGKLDGDVVQCPWHGSRFNVHDGSVVDGPATFPQPRFETRVREGQIEVRSMDRQGIRHCHFVITESGQKTQKT